MAKPAPDCDYCGGTGKRHVGYGIFGRCYCLDRDRQPKKEK
jgi:hypothetical protein